MRFVLKNEIWTSALNHLIFLYILFFSLLSQISCHKDHFIGFYSVLHVTKSNKPRPFSLYLTIIPQALMDYWLRGHEGERNNCFSKIQLAGQKYRDKTTLAG